MAKRYSGQVVVVTGGGRGIGRATALEFAAEGATLVLAGRRMDALRLAGGEVRDAGGRADIVRCDAVDEEDLQALVEKTMTKHGRIDVLVNNAGVMALGRLDEMEDEDVRRLVDVNIWAVIRLTQIALPHMRKARAGTIVNVSSVAGRMGMPYFSVYCASKFAIRGFSEALRRELRPDRIHVMAVYPGVTATDMTESVDLGGIGVSVATAQQVGAAILRGVRWRVPEVFIDLGESLMSRWNDFLPWTVDYGVDLMREPIRRAAAQHKTT